MTMWDDEWNDTSRDDEWNDTSKLNTYPPRQEAPGRIQISLAYYGEQQTAFNLQSLNGDT